MQANTTIDTAKVYSIIADTMPTEGRDFTMDAVQDGSNTVKLVIHPLTAVGRGFVPTLLERLSEQMKGQNVSFAADGVAEREVATINTIKAAVERDAMASLEATLSDITARQKKKRDEMANEDKVRGQRMMSSDETKKRVKDTQELRKLAAQQKQIKYMLAHMDEARTRVNEAARKNAEQDAKNGIDWTIDFDAPLTTLFDRRDAEDKLGRLETSIHQVAAHMFMIEDMTAAAASVGKQYVLHK